MKFHDSTCKYINSIRFIQFSNILRTANNSYAIPSFLLLLLSIFDIEIYVHKTLFHEFIDTLYLNVGIIHVQGYLKWIESIIW